MVVGWIRRFKIGRESLGINEDGWPGDSGNSGARDGVGRIEPREEFEIIVRGRPQVRVGKSPKPVFLFLTHFGAAGRNPD
jgi:hypothetical protein